MNPFIATFYVFLTIWGLIRLRREFLADGITKTSVFGALVGTAGVLTCMAFPNLG